MPHGSVTKNDILARVYKMKNELYDGDYDVLGNGMMVLIIL